MIRLGGRIAFSFSSAVVPIIAPPNVAFALRRVWVGLCGCGNRNCAKGIS